MEFSTLHTRSLAALEAVRTLNNRADAVLEAIGRREGLTSSECRLLWEIGGIRGVIGTKRPTELATETGLSAATVSFRLRRLQDRGLVRRTTDESDRRAVEIVMTKSGLEIARATYRGWAAEHEKSFAALSAEEINLLAQLGTLVGVAPRVE